MKGGCEMQSSGRLRGTQIVTAAIGFILASVASDEGAFAQTCTPHWDVGIGQPGIPPGVADLETYSDGGAQLFAARAVSEQPSAVFVLSGNQWGQVGGQFDGNVWALQACDLQDASALYAAGDFTVAGGIQANYIAKWNGFIWSPLNGGTDGPVYAMVCVSIGSVPSLVVGGSFTSAGGEPAKNIARWDGDAWSSLTTGPTDGEIRALVVHDDGRGLQLYAAGNFSQIDGVAANSIAKWDGTAWSPLGTGTNDGMVFVRHSAGSVLYAGGAFSSIGEIQAANRIARWDGNEWMPLGTGVEGSNAQVNAIATYRDNPGTAEAVFIGGIFSTAGGTEAHNIARWNGFAWFRLEGGTSGQVGALHLFPTEGGAHQHLVVGGWFTAAGGLPANSMAAWVGCADPCPWDTAGPGGGPPDGDVGINDFLDLLEHWGPCP